MGTVVTSDLVLLTCFHLFIVSDPFVISAFWQHIFLPVACLLFSRLRANFRLSVHTGLLIDRIVCVCVCVCLCAWLISFRWNLQIVLFCSLLSNLCTCLSHTLFMRARVSSLCSVGSNTHTHSAFLWEQINTVCTGTLLTFHWNK